MTSGEPHLPRAPRRTVTAVLMLILGTTLSVVIFLRARAWEGENLQVEFTRRAAICATTVQRSVQAHLEALYGVGAFYGATQAVGREGFREYAKGLLGRHEGLQALAWVPRVFEAERETYLATARKDGLADLQITEPTPQGQGVRVVRRDVYYPIVYVEPQVSYTALLGLNLGSEPARLDAMQKALSRAEVMASAWGPLPQESGEHWGFLLFLPIYKSGMPSRTLEERRANLRGFVAGLCRLGAMMERPFKELALGDLDVRLADATDAASSRLLHLQLRAAQEPRLAFVPRQTTEVEAIRAGLYWETAFNVAGRRWTVLVRLAPEARSAHTWQSWGMLVIGLLFTVLFASLLLHWTARQG
jgi:CHASE1-domain containing sensor protein